MKSMKRALRRHHVARLKAARHPYWRMDLRLNHKFLSMVVHTPKPCSCWMCGNARRYFKEDSVAERSFFGQQPLIGECRD